MVVDRAAGCGSELAESCRHALGQAAGVPVDGVDREPLGIRAADRLPLEGQSRRGTETRAVFTLDGPGAGVTSAGTGRWEVRVHTEVGEPRQLTCRATSASSGFSHRLTGMSRL